MSDHVTIPGLGAIVRHSWQTVLVGKLMPIVIFLAALPFLGVDLAIVAALAWSMAVLGYQRRAGQRVAGLVVLSVIGNAVRSALAMATGSTFFYFAQPTLSTIVIGVAFAVSVPMRQPLAGRLISDFCPFDLATANHPEFRRFFRSASLLWSGSSLINGAITIYLLTSQSLTGFLVAKAFLGPSLTALTLVAGIALFRGRMRRSGITVNIARRVSKVTVPTPTAARNPALVA